MEIIAREATWKVSWSTGEKLMKAPTGGFMGKRLIFPVTQAQEIMKLQDTPVEVVEEK